MTTTILTTTHVRLFGFGGRCRGESPSSVPHSDLSTEGSASSCTHHKARHVNAAEALSRLAVERDVRVAKDVVDELVHGGLFKLARLARAHRELARALDLFSEEVRDVCA